MTETLPADVAYGDNGAAHLVERDAASLTDDALNLLADRMDTHPFRATQGPNWPPAMLLALSWPAAFGLRSIKEWKELREQRVAELGRAEYRRWYDARHQILEKVNALLLPDGINDSPTVTVEDVRALTAA